MLPADLVFCACSKNSLPTRYYNEETGRRILPRRLQYSLKVDVSPVYFPNGQRQFDNGIGIYNSTVLSTSSCTRKFIRSGVTTLESARADANVFSEVDLI